MQKGSSRSTLGAVAIGLLALLLLALLSIYSTNRVASGQSPIQLSAKLVGSDFRWVNSGNGAINPTLMLMANSGQNIQIQNPTQAVHQLIIDFNGQQVATSGDIAPGSSGQVLFKSSMTGTFGYHCLYHPSTMKGIIQVR